MAYAIFAGGCFWCMVPPFEKIKGVIDIKSGYCGGNEDEPNYWNVSLGNTNHREAVRIKYDPKKVDYNTLVDIFWKNIDPTDDGGQFYDRGHQYMTAIFYLNEKEKKIALESKEKLQKSKRFKDKIVTDILPLKKFYLAESYHQNYHNKNPVHYNLYSSTSGRKKFIKKHWKK